MNHLVTKEATFKTDVSEIGAFIKAILPSEGYFFIATNRAGEVPFPHHSFTNSDDAMEFVAEQRESGINIFLSHATFSKPFADIANRGTGKLERKYRVKGNWCRSRSFLFDIDVGNDKAWKYNSKEDALKALKMSQKVFAKYGLTFGAVVHSGHGLQAYFTLNEDITDIADYERLSGKLVTAALLTNLKLDSGASDNAVGLLRLPGTINDKSHKKLEPVQASIMRPPSITITTANFEHGLNRLIAELGNKAPNTGQSLLKNTNQTPKPPELESVLRECEALRQTTEDENHAYEEWYAAINLARACSDSENAIHVVSRQHVNYSAEETDAKAATFAGGPTLCKTFQGLNLRNVSACSRCRWTNDPRVKTPWMAAVIAESERSVPKINGEIPFSTIETGGKFRIISNAKLSKVGLNGLDLMTPDDARNPIIKYLRTLKHSESDASRIYRSWLSAPSTTHYQGIAFDPLNHDKAALNLWQGPSINPDYAGDCNTLLAFVQEVICANNLKLNDYLLSWLAHAVQRPEEKPGTMIWLLGGQGIGKGTFFRLISSVWERTTIQINDVKNIFGDFNGALEGAFFVWLDEALFANSSRIADLLKGFVTESQLQINQKYQPLRTVNSIHRVLAATNHEHAAQAGLDDRRGVFLRVSEHRKNNHAYWDSLKPRIQIEAPALLAFLMSRDISNFNPARDKPNTNEGLRQKISSLKGAHKVWFDILHQGGITNRLGEIKSWDCELRTSEIIYHAREIGIRASDKGIKEALKKLCPSAVLDRIGKDPHRFRGYLLPELDDARAELITALGGGLFDWD